MKDVSKCYDANNTIIINFHALKELQNPSTHYLAMFDHDPAYLAQCDYFDTVSEDVLEMWMKDQLSVRQWLPNSGLRRVSIRPKRVFQNTTEMLLQNLLSNILGFSNCFPDFLLA